MTDIRAMFLKYCSWFPMSLPTYPLFLWISGSAGLKNCRYKNSTIFSICRNKLTWTDLKKAICEFFFFLCLPSTPILIDCGHGTVGMGNILFKNIALIVTYVLMSLQEERTGLNGCKICTVTNVLKL